MLAETPTRLSHLLQKNKEWVQSQPKELFQKLASGQSPEVLWISCSDSRVCPNTMVGTGPGELFVSRNIANVVSSSDLSLLSVMTYAVDVLKVKHVVVLGHFGCGGVSTSL